jgi:hypothetical protein
VPAWASCRWRSRLASLSLSRTDRDRARREGLKYYEVVGLPPGTYDVRLAAREDGSGRLGSASARVEIPDLGEGSLALGGPFLLKAESAAGGSDATRLTEVQALPRFRQSDSLYYQLQVLNPRRDPSGEPRLTIQAHVLEAGQRRASTPEAPLELQDGGAIPMADTGRIELSPLAPGTYELEVVVSDTLGGARVSGSVGFDVES